MKEASDIPAAVNIEPVQFCCKYFYGTGVRSLAAALHQISHSQTRIRV